VIDALRARAAAQPAHPALRGAASCSYAELVASMDAVATRLRAAGVRPGDRVGLVARQGRPFVEHALGILAAGGCMAPIPEDTAERALESHAREAHLHHLLHVGGAPEWRSFTDVTPVDGAGDEAFRALRPAYLRFTSGTTSRRKGVVLGHAAIGARLDHANQGLRITSADRVLWLLPMAHHFVVSILLYLREGATILLPPGGLARPILELASAEGATVSYASPFHYHLLSKDASGIALPDLRLAVSTAEGLRAEVAERFRARFARALVQALGIMEVGLPVLNLASAEAKPEALGRALPGYTVWLRGEDGAPVERSGPERTGEVCIRGPGLLDAYLAPWTPASALLEQGSFRTGDQGWIDADGDLWLAGRRANRINMAGMKFFCEEVEAVLDAAPGVRQSRVSARVHPQLGEIPIAEIVPEDPARPPAARDLVAHCRERLASYKIPRELRIVAELPRTATGKVARWSGEPT
jgi:long-chain acyl-CoA synthetase